MFLRHIHTFRALAILFVVASHCLPQFAAPDDSALMRPFLSFISNGTVLFVFVAGYLFQHLGENFRYRTYLGKKLRNVIVPYLVVSTPLIAMHAWRSTGPFDPTSGFVGSPALQVLWAYLTGGGAAPLWFIPMIAGYYLLAPLFHVVDRSRHGYWVLVPLVLLSLLVHRPSSVHDSGHAGLYFLFPYVFGMFCSHHRARVDAALERHLWPLLGLTLLVLAYNAWWSPTPGAVSSQSPFSIENGLIDISLVLKTLMCLLALHLLQRWDHLLFGPLERVASLSVGIYFIHSYVLLGQGTLMHEAGATLQGTAWTVALATVLVTALSMVLIMMVQQVAGRRSRLLVGC